MVSYWLFSLFSGLDLWCLYLRSSVSVQRKSTWTTLNVRVTTHLTHLISRHVSEWPSSPAAQVTSVSESLSEPIALWAACRHTALLWYGHPEFESWLEDLSRSHRPISLSLHLLSVLIWPIVTKGKNAKNKSLNQFSVSVKLIIWSPCLTLSCHSESLEKKLNVSLNLNVDVVRKMSRGFFDQSNSSSKTLQQSVLLDSGFSCFNFSIFMLVRAIYHSSSQSQSFGLMGNLVFFSALCCRHSLSSEDTNEFFTNWDVVRKLYVCSWFSQQDGGVCRGESTNIRFYSDIPHWAKLRPKDVFLKSLQTLKRRPLRSQNESLYDVFFWRVLHVWYRPSCNLRTRLKTSSNVVNGHHFNIIWGSFRLNSYCLWTKYTCFFKVISIYNFKATHRHCPKIMKIKEYSLKQCLIKWSNNWLLSIW